VLTASKIRRKIVTKGWESKVFKIPINAFVERWSIIMIDDVKQTECTGCKVCADICPKEAIVFGENKEGFWYPQIDESRCIKCNICVKHCPVINNVIVDNNLNPDVYAGWTLNNHIRYESTSGGVYYELAKKFLEDNGYIAGCAFSDDYKSAKHVIGKTTEDLNVIMGSKYFQSDTNGIYIKLKALIDSGEKVLFCGTPCQVAAVISFFQGIPDDLFLLDFICKGINSPLAYKAYMHELEEKYRSKILKVRMKNKKYGWESLATHVIFSNGKEYLKDRYNDWWILGYTCGNLFMRENCQRCQHKKIPRLSDITIGDFWGINGCSQKDYEEGISVIFINSKKGKKLLENVQDRMHLESRKFEDVLKGNPYFMEQAPAHKNRELFFTSLKEMPFSKAVRLSYTESTVQKCKRWIKIFLKRICKRKKW